MKHATTQNSITTTLMCGAVIKTTGGKHLTVATRIYHGAKLIYQHYSDTKNSDWEQIVAQHTELLMWYMKRGATEWGIVIHIGTNPNAPVQNRPSLLGTIKKMLTLKKQNS